MNRDDIIRMAREVGLTDWETSAYGNQLEWFANLVAAAEREACAKVCDRFQARNVGMQPAECAGAIRARGQE
jgi:hypothetical protein